MFWVVRGGAWQYFLVLVLFSILSIFGVFSVSGFNFLNVTLVLEVFVFSLVFMTALRFVCNSVYREMLLLFLLFLFLFLFFGLVAVVYGGSGLGDFVQAYKVFVYIPLLAVFSNYFRFSGRVFYLEYVVWILCVAFFIKYAVSKYIVGIPRPGLFTENNFELPFLFLVFAASFDFIRKGHRGGLFFVIFLITVMSGSRSAMAGVCALYAFLFIDRFDFKVVFKFSVLILVLAVFYQVLIDRSIGGVESIDRFVFLSVFLDEIESWSWMNYIFGTLPITPLSVSGCMQLQFYESMISNSDSSLCYSVIFHSLLLRGGFDYGLLGLLGVFYAYYRILRFSCVNLRLSLLFLTLAVLSAVSVASLNSVYFTWGAIFLITSTKWKAA